jgi:hypothetical protein
MVIGLTFQHALHCLIEFYFNKYVDMPTETFVKLATYHLLKIRMYFEPIKLV